jgi:hypothetical protein
MTAKFDRFKADLVALCEKHDVMIATSGYDSFTVWDRDPRDEAIYQDAINDETS